MTSTLDLRPIAREQIPIAGEAPAQAVSNDTLACTPRPIPKSHRHSQPTRHHGPPRGPATKRSTIGFA
jgi:hypothetical protein